MATTDVMEGEDIGGLTRRHFIKMIGVAAGLAATGTAGILLTRGLSGSNHSTNQAEMFLMREEPKWLGQYAEIRKKYAEHIEAGRKYIGQQYGANRDDITVRVFDEVAHCEQGIMSPQCPIQEGIFVAYSYPKGYVGLVVGKDRRIMEYDTFTLPDDQNKLRAIRFFQQDGTLDSKMVSGVVRISEDERNFEVTNKKPEEDYLFKLHVNTGWDNGRGRPNHASYIVNLKKETVEYIMTL